MIYMDKKRLEKILEIKEKQKKEKERELKKALQDLQLEQEKLKNLQKEMEYMEEVLNNEIITSNIELYHHYLITLSERINKKEIDVKKKDIMVQKNREELLHNYRETRAFNIVKDNLIKKEIKNVILNEQKESDFDYLTRKLKK